MRVLLIGSTGLLGQNIRREFIQRKFNVVGVARKGADYNFDITNKNLLYQCFIDEKPDIVINAAAIVDLSYCEKKPLDAYLVNTRIVSDLVDFCRKINAYYIQISTDHYYTGDERKRHKETDRIRLLNEYARTKYLGERIALLYENSLTIRTNIVGVRGKLGSPTFYEWVKTCLDSKVPMTLFSDFYTSSITARQLAQILLEIVQIVPTGLINIASHDVNSKSEFVFAVAKQLGIEEFPYTIGSVKNVPGIKRAESLGLDVTKAENLLGHSLPCFSDVINCIGSCNMKGAV